MAVREKSEARESPSMEDRGDTRIKDLCHSIRREKLQDGPPTTRRMGGWGDERRKKAGDHIEDERLQVHEDLDDDIPIIPDLEDVREEELTAQMAAPPSVAVNRVATFKQLDSDLHKHAGLFTLDGGIDLKVLARVLSPESEIAEEDKPWGWNRLFAECSPDIQEVWDHLKEQNTVTVVPKPSDT